MEPRKPEPTNPPEVRLFRQILIWPLLIKNRLDGDDGEKPLTRWVKELCDGEHWRLAEGDRARPYEEVVYFHPFVRDFLYGDANRDPDRRPMRVLERPGVSRVRIRLRKETRELILGVERVQLYAFETGVILLAIEIVHQNPESVSEGYLTLADVMEIQDRFRRVYPPYWEEGGPEAGNGGHCPSRVEWMDGAEVPSIVVDRERNLVIRGASNFEHKSDFVQFTKYGAEPPVAEHWRYFLHPMTPFDGKEEKSGPIQVQQIEDERIPSMTYLALDRPRDLTCGDFVRLTFLDGKGDPDSLPYSNEFLKGFEKDYCYDRFWDPNPKDSEQWLSTRYLCCGYSFTAIGDQRSFYFRDVISHHFRNHYFKIGLITHFHRASLLMFADRLSEAVKKFQEGRRAGGRYAAFRREVTGIQDDLLRFRSRYWFTEVSNQDQGKDLFDLWSRHLRTKDLFEQILDETRTVNDVLDAREQAGQTAASIRLTVVATVGLILSLFLSGLALDSDRLGLATSIVVGVSLVLVILGLFFSDPLTRIIGRFTDRGQNVWDRCRAYVHWSADEALEPDERGPRQGTER